MTSHEAEGSGAPSPGPDVDRLDLPDGDLAFSRVVPDATAALTAALDRRHTGYAVFTPSDALVLDDGTQAILGFRDGIPTHAVSEAEHGAGALAAAATPGPLRVTLHDCDPPITRLDARIEPDTPARQLAGDDALASRTRDAAPERDSTGGDATIPDAGDDLDAVEAFLADEDAIARLKAQAREEAERRAKEWGFDEFQDAN